MGYSPYTRERRHREGRCVDCEADPEPGKSRCARHLKRQAELSSGRRYWWRNLGRNLVAAGLAACMDRDRSQNQEALEGKKT